MKMVQFFKTGSDFFNTGSNQRVRTQSIQVDYTDVCNLIQYVAGFERMRFGYVDRNSEFAFTYEGKENDLTVFPGKYSCT